MSFLLETFARDLHISSHSSFTNVLYILPQSNFFSYGFHVSYNFFHKNTYIEKIYLDI